MNQYDFRKMISGQKTGFGATLLRFLLGVASLGYLLAIDLRNFLYSARWLKTHSTDAVVISIGNITTGGTGKTPLVIWLCKRIISDSRFQDQVSEPVSKSVSKVYHVDLYRIEGQASIDSLGLEECFEDKEAVVLLEWANRLPKNSFPEEYKRISIEIVSKNRRKFDILDIASD